MRARMQMAGVAILAATAAAAQQVPLPPQPAPTSAVEIACPNARRVTGQALRLPGADAAGEVLVEFVVDTDGRVRDSQVVRSANPVLDRTALAAVQRFRCISQGQEVRVQVPFAFRRER